MMRYATLLGIVLAVFLAAPAPGEVFLNYVGAQDMGDGTFLHEYEGVRSIGDVTDIRDLHIEGKFEWEQGTISLTAPGNWNTMIYTGPGQIFYNWQIEEGSVWDSGNLVGFGILVSSPTISSTPFYWTNNSQLPALPDLGSVVSGGTTFAPVPEPASLTMLGMGALCMLGFFRWRRRAS